MRKKMNNSFAIRWLYGWKDIAAYIGCSVKTARHYHTELKLPIRRLSSEKGVKIMAKMNDIDHWIERTTRSG